MLFKQCNRHRFQFEKEKIKYDWLCFMYNHAFSCAIYKISSASTLVSLNTILFLWYHILLIIAIHSPLHTRFCFLYKWNHVKKIWLTLSSSYRHRGHTLEFRLIHLLPRLVLVAIFPKITLQANIYAFGRPLINQKRWNCSALRLLILFCR